MTLAAETFSNTEKVNAWIIPEKADEPWMPLGSRPRTFGYQPKMCDIRLTRFSAGAVQAQLIWTGEDLLLCSLADNNETRLNGETVGAKAVPVYHREILDVCGKGFSVYRSDKKCRPDVKFKITFMCEGENIGEELLKKGEKAHFPRVPFLREESSGLREFVRWENASHEAVSENNTYSAETTLYAIYKNYIYDAVTFSSRDKMYLMNLATGNVMEVDGGGFLFGSGKLINCSLSTKPGQCAVIEHGRWRLTCQRSGELKLNGNMLAAGDSHVLYEADRIEFCGNVYSVIGNKKAPVKYPSLVSVDGKGEVLTGLSEGKVIFIGRDYQTMLASNMFIGHRHASIRMEQGRYYVRDQGSKNGSSLVRQNSCEEIALCGDKEVELKNGDKIKLFIFEYVFSSEE